MNPAEAQAAQQQTELGGLQLAKARQAISDDQQQRTIAQSTTDPTQLASAYYKAGLVPQAQAAQKFQMEQRKNQIDTGKTMQEVMGGPLKFLADNPTMENAAATFQHLNSIGIMTPEQVSSAVKQLQADPSPDGIKTFAMRGYQSAISADKQLPTLKTSNTGGQTVTQALNPLNGQQVGMSAVNNTQSPDSIATNATSRANNSATIANSSANNAATNQKDLQVAGINPDGTPQGDVESMAQGIASGKLAPLSGFSLAKPRGQAIMARAMEINPNYDAGDYTAKNAALKAFSTGKEGAQLRSFNVASDHLDTLGQMADALNNGNIQVLNRIGNAWNQQTGNPAPTNFDAVKEIVGKEVVKAIVAGGGGVGERQEVSDLMQKANSPAQLKGVISHFKDLMDAQKAGLMDQYQRTTGRTDGPQIFAPSKPAATPMNDVNGLEAEMKRRGLLK